MLEASHSLPIRGDRIAMAEETYDWKWMAKAIFRRIPLILTCAVLFMGLGFAHVFTRTPSYTASTVLNVTSLRLMATGQDTFFAESQQDPTLVETQIQIMGSDPVVRAALERLGRASGTPEEMQEAVKRLQARLNIQRVGQSNLAEISVADPDRAEAARIANAVANSYLARLESEREETIQSGSSWLRQRLRGVGPQATVVAPAMPPLHKSGIGGLPILAVTAIAGGGIGLFLALVLGFLDRRIREPEQALAVTGVECVGMVPPMRAPKPRKEPRRGQPAPVAAPGSFCLDAGPAMLSAVERHPFSPLWHALRHASIVSFARRGQTRARMIGITAATPGSGATTIAANFALLAAEAGRRVLLVDAQPYAADLSRLLAGDAKGGLVPFLAESTGSLAPHILSDRTRRIDLLPFGATGTAAAAGAQALWSPRMLRLMSEAAGYDLIVFDLPPLAASADIASASAYLDGLLLVIQWGSVSSEQITAALALAEPARDRLVGSILNEATLNAMDRWFSPQSAILAGQAGFAPKPGAPRPGRG